VRVEGDLVAMAKKIFPDGAEVVVDSTGVAAVLPKASGPRRAAPSNPRSTRTSRSCAALAWKSLSATVR
jgi:hypothetical protein